MGNLSIILERLEVKKTQKLIIKNDLLFTGPKIDHAMLYTEKTAILVLSKILEIKKLMKLTQ